MEKDTHKLPDPKPQIARGPRGTATSYAALARANDRLMARAELALREASCLWGDIDHGLERLLDDLAQDIHRRRNDVVETVRDLYGDRLGEDPL